MLGVLPGHLGKAEPAFVHEDERVGPFVRGPTGGHRLEDGHAHHVDQRGVLDEDRVALRLRNLLTHVPLLPQLSEA